ncbi:hypothetical protein [Streptomyces sp. LN785]|uniref:hypothetical protein n=1 Tax=Streptomyces sp. LN785 TaxID=3112983 RepID=UPI00371465CA
MARRYESESAAGTPLTVDDVVELLTPVTAELPARTEVARTRASRRAAAPVPVSDS